PGPSCRTSPRSHCNRGGFCDSKAPLHHSLARCRRRGGMTYPRLWLMVLAGLVASGLGLFPRHAGATLRFGPLEISGNAQSQNLFRTPDASTWEYIQNRNTAHILLNYDWLEGGKWIGKYSIPFIEKSSLTLLWRGVYDSIYDTTPGFLQKDDIHGKNYPFLNPQTGKLEFVNYFTYATKVGIPKASGAGNKLLTIPNLDLRSLG